MVGYFGAVQNALTIAEASTRLAVSRDVVEELIRSGALLALDVSPRAGQLHHRPLWRIREADLAAFVESRLAGTARPTPPRTRPKKLAVHEFVK